MSWMLYDPDEWKTVISSGTWGKYPGTNLDYGWLSVGQERRSDDEIAQIKAEKQRLHEEAVLREADAIRARRALGTGATS